MENTESGVTRQCNCDNFISGFYGSSNNCVIWKNMTSITTLINNVFIYVKQFGLLKY